MSYRETEKRGIMDAIEEAASVKSHYGSPVTPVRKKEKNLTKHHYIHHEVDLQKTPFLLFPPGKEMLFLGIYFITVPYIVGILFLFTYIAEFNISVFRAVGTDSSLLLTWTVGYEIIAAIILLYIMINAVKFSLKNR